MFSWDLPDALVESIARRAAELVQQEQDDEDRGFLDVAGAAAFLGNCSRKRIYNLVESGDLPFEKPAGRLLFCPKALREWVETKGRM